MEKRKPSSGHYLQDMRHEKKSPVGNRLNALICTLEY
jgi:hypothetical protein